MAEAIRTDAPNLPELALTEWEASKTTLHLWLQIVGKIRLASTAPRNHWWHAPLYLDVRGLTTRRLHAANGTAFEIVLDFVDHRLVVTTNRGATESFPLRDGLSVAGFDRELHALLDSLDIDVEIEESPYRVPTTTPFPEDGEHASYDPDAVARFWRILDWSDEVLEEFAGWYAGKTSPVHLFWHGFDLAVTRFSGRRAPVSPDADPVTQAAYSHEVVSFGFWAGDDKVREASYYSYTSPEPPDLRSQPLSPGDARWTESLALLPYESVRAAHDPRRHLLAFLESAYRAGAQAPTWDRDDLASSWYPDPPELSRLLGPGF
jgi:Family of unknown function (DUF5996)